MKRRLFLKILLTMPLILPLSCDKKAKLNNKKKWNDLYIIFMSFYITNSDPIDMCIGVGGYPEKHLEAPNFKSDIQG